MTIENHIISPYAITLNDIEISSEQIAEIDSLTKTPGGGLIVICGESNKGKTTTFNAVTNHILSTRKLKSDSTFILSEDFDKRDAPIFSEIVSAVMGGAQYIGIDGYVQGDPRSLLTAIRSADAPGVLTVVTYHAEASNIKARLREVLAYAEPDSEFGIMIENNLIGVISQDLIREDAHMVKPNINVVRLRDHVPDRA